MAPPPDLKPRVPRLEPLPRDLESALRREGLIVKEERARGHVALKVWAGEIGSPRPSPVICDDETAHDDARADARPDARADALAESRPVLASFTTVPGENLDHHDRVQIALCLTHVVRPAVPRPRLWLTRSGSPDPCPEDWAWIAAAHEAWTALNLAPDYALVTREGWTLHPSGRARRWRRLRV